MGKPYPGVSWHGLVVGAMAVTTTWVPVAASGKSAAPSPTSAAAERAVQFLLKRQLPSGGFSLCWNFDAPVCDPEETSLAATFVVEAVRSLPGRRARTLRQRALAFIANEQEPDGFWRFWTAADVRHQESGPDADDTACAAAVLPASALPRDHWQRLQSLQTPEGLFVTWKDPGALGAAHRAYRDDLLNILGHPAPEGNDIDCGVNANVLWYAATRQQALPEVCAYLVRAVQTGDLPRCSLYYVSAPHLDYLIARAYAAGATCLAPAIEAMRRTLLAQQQPDGSWGDDLETACAAAALLRIGYRGPPIERAVALLVAHQRADGSWPACRFIAANHGAAALTTAIILEVLTRVSGGSA